MTPWSTPKLKAHRHRIKPRSPILRCAILIPAKNEADFPVDVRSSARALCRVQTFRNLSQIASVRPTTLALDGGQRPTTQQQKAAIQSANSAARLNRLGLLQKAGQKR